MEREKNSYRDSWKQLKQLSYHSITTILTEAARMFSTVEDSLLEDSVFTVPTNNTYIVANSTYVYLQFQLFE